MTHGSLFVAPVPGTPPAGMSAIDGRLAIAGIFGSSSQLVAGGGITASGVNMGFTIGQAVWEIADVTNAAAAFFSPTDQTVLTPAAGPGTGSRKELVCVRARNYENGDADSQASVLLVSGTAGSPGVDPAVPSGYYKYATITVPTSATLATSCTVQIFGNTTFAPPDLKATTLALLNLTTGALGQQGTVTGDGGNNGIYLWNGSAWSAARPKGSRVQLGETYVSSAGGGFSVPASMGDVTGASVTATSAGGKVRITAVGLLSNANSGAARSAQAQVLCDGALVGEATTSPGYFLPLNSGAQAPTQFVHTQSHTPAAGSHTWKLQAAGGSSGAVFLFQPTVTVEEYV